MVYRIEKVFYDPRRDFNCLDGSGTLSFSQVNDDYCDCEDGSDEPGTSACSNGVFHCPNVGFVEKNILSNRVNDKICDCCDGSDEYGPHGASCINNCLALGEKSREERRLYLQQLKEGSKVRNQYVEDAKNRKSQYETELHTLKGQLQEMEGIKAEKEAVKNAAEDKEKEALDRIREEQEIKKKEREELEEKQREAEEKAAAETAFHELDSNEDGILSFEELKQHIVFDQDADGVVSDDEAKFFLHMKDTMELEEFVTTGWVISKPYYLKEKVPPVVEHQEESEVITAPPHEDFPEEQHETESQIPEEEFDDEEDNPRDFTTDSAHSDPHIPDPALKAHETENYDEETKSLVEAAKKARLEFRDVESRFFDVSKRVKDLENTLGIDYGADDAFLPLHGQCFELTDREYIYKLCPFDRASQRPKDGGAETSLGKWGRWAGVDNLYTRMKYEGGATCWNGPARSVDVSLRCGLENEVLSASEPNRCEYAFEFRTPALCVIQDEHLSNQSHDEL